MPGSTLSELKEERDAKRSLLQEVFGEAETEGEDGEESHDFRQVECLGTAVNELEGSEKSARVAQIVDELRGRIEELDEEIVTAEAVEGYKATEERFEKQRKRPPLPDAVKDRGQGDGMSFKQIARRIIEDPEFKSNGPCKIKVETSWGEAKTLMTTSAGFPAEATRTGRVVDIPLRPLQVMDIIPMGMTGQHQVVYMQQDTRTQAAAEVDEGGSKPEATLAFSEATSPVREIAVSLPVTEIQLEDVPFIQSLVETMLREDINERLDKQIIAGDGSAPNLEGIVNVTGILTQAKGTDSRTDAIRKAMTKIRIGAARAQPTHVLLHPNDWQEIELETTSQGEYLFGGPVNISTRQIWGLPVVENEALSEGTGLVGAFAARNIQLVERRGIVLERGVVGSQFVENKLTIRASMRAALPTYRPKAFCTVTSI